MTTITINVARALIFDPEGKILLTLRHPGKHDPLNQQDYWELPGGKAKRTGTIVCRKNSVDYLHRKLDTICLLQEVMEETGVYLSETQIDKAQYLSTVHMTGNGYNGNDKAEIITNIYALSISSKDPSYPVKDSDEQNIQAEFVSKNEALSRFRHSPQAGIFDVVSLFLAQGKGMTGYYRREAGIPETIQIFMHAENGADVCHLHFNASKPEQKQQPQNAEDLQRSRRHQWPQSAA